jgi:hypothetical protein
MSISVHIPFFDPRAWPLGRTDVGKQLLRKLHAARNMALFPDLKVQGEYGLRAIVLDPSHEPAHRRTHPASRRFIIDTDQSRFGADHGIPDFGNRKNIAFDVTRKRAADVCVSGRHKFPQLVTDAPSGL